MDTAMPETLSAFPSISFTDSLQQAGAKDLVLTASNRLAREIRQRFAESGRIVLPRVLPYAAWLGECWQRLRFEKAISGSQEDEGLRLLGERQEEVLWDQVLRDAGAEERLLFLDETVRACMRASALLEQYRLPREHASWQRSEECRLFLEWQQAVSEECARQGWLSSAQLPGWLGERLGALPGLRGQKVFLAGFDEMTPAQETLFAALGQIAEGMCVVDEPAWADSERRWLHVAADAEAEWCAAAQWAQRRLSESPEGRFAVVVPDLAEQNAHVSRVFQGVFHPETVSQSGPSGSSAFHLSFAPPLVSSSLAQAGLYLLRVMESAPALGDLRYLLRSPYVDGGMEEAEARALLEAKLLGERLDRVPFEQLRKVAASLEQDLPTLRLSRWHGLVENLKAARDSADATRQRAPSAWVQFVRALWAKALWLDATLTSAEFQLRQRLLEELGAMATLDVVLSECSLERFARLLRGHLERTGFQAELPGGQVLVAGMFEVTGIRFDGVWICGLTDRTLPRAIAPDPFLPLELQRAAKLPRADVAQEREFASNLFGRLCRLAPELVLSYPTRSGDEALLPSPLLRALGNVDAYLELALAEDQPKLKVADVEIFEDWNGGPFAPSEARLSGGVTVLKNQSDCPFRAYAVARLGSDAIDWQAPLMDRLDQGSLVHEALEAFWDLTSSREALLALDDEQRARRIAECVEKAINSFRADPDDLLALAQKDAERERLLRMLSAWMEEEGARVPFTVAALEAKRTMRVGEAELRLRADRLDLLNDGSYALIDYKTGKTDPRKWLGERPEEPQLLAYFAAETRPVSTLAFASLKAGEMGWKCYGKAVDTNFKPIEGRRHAEPPEGWESFVGNARDVVDRLRAEFEAGFAVVDPREPKVTCKYCVQQPFCRISEASAKDDDENGGEDQ